MQLFILFLALGGFIALCLGGIYLWARYADAQSTSRFSQDIQALGFTDVVAKEVHTDLQQRLTTLPTWKTERVQLQAVVYQQIETVQVYFLVCEQTGEIAANQFAVALFISPDLQLPGFYLRPKRTREKEIFTEALPRFSQNFVIECEDKAATIAHFPAYPAQHYANWWENNGWYPRIRLAGFRNHFICFSLTNKWPDTETIERLTNEGLQHMQAHKSAVSRQTS